MSESLAEIYKRHSLPGDPGHGDKGTMHSYIDAYECLLAPYRNGCTLMEIGIAYGLSLAMWREYMPASQIIGVDLSIVFDPTPHRASGTILIECDATKPEFAEAIKNYSLDVVIDDASHNPEHQKTTFQLVKPRMNKGGIYVIEDIHDINRYREMFMSMHHRCEVIDLRHIKPRFDDMLIVYRF